MATTIRDVAKLAGTSIGAVSAVLNGGSRHNIRVGDATRKRILAASRKLGYVPHPVARSLVLRKTGVIGLVFPYSSAFVDRNPFSTQIMSGVFEEAIRQQQNIMLHTAIGDDWNAADENVFIDRRVDGSILVLPAPKSPLVAACLREKFPSVAIVYEADHKDMCVVNADEFTGGRLATQHLIDLGHRRIAHLAGDVRVATTGPRRQGYLSALRAAGRRADVKLIVDAGFDQEGGYTAMRKLLDYPASRRPTAVFAANDLCAEGAIRAINERNMQVPEDIALVGYDDTWFAGITRPALTSVHMPIREMAIRAVRMLCTMIRGEEVVKRHWTLPVSLTIRQSCGAGTLPQTKEKENVETTQGLYSH